jgi:transcription antitermination factor NusA-like protein
MTFRMYMSNQHAGTIIGKGGANVKKIREQSGCKVSIAEQGPGELERVVSIIGTAPAVNHAIELIVDVLEEAYGDAPPTDPSLGMGGEPPPHVFKLLLTNNQVGGIIGKGGATIKQMREESGAMIKVEASGTMGNERVVIVTAAKTAVLVALSLIAAKLSQMPDDAPPPHQRQRTGPASLPGHPGGMQQRYGAPQMQQPWAGMPQGHGGAPPSQPGYPGAGYPAAQPPAYGASYGSQYAAPGTQPQAGYAPPPGGQSAAASAGFPSPNGYASQPYSAQQPYAAQQGYGQGYAPPQTQPYAQGQGYAQAGYPGYGAEAAAVHGGYGSSAAVAPVASAPTQTANGVEQLVPVQLIGRLIGRGGSGIKELREVTRAMIKIESECLPGTDQRKVTISGTPEQTQLAISMIQTRLAMGP